MTKGTRKACGIITILGGFYALLSFLIYFVPHINNISHFALDFEYFRSLANTAAFGCVALIIFGGFLLAFDKSIGGVLAIFGVIVNILVRGFIEYPQIILPVLGQPLPFIGTVLSAIINIGVLAICLITSIIGLHTGSES